jgi:hypothetical protein
MSKSNRYKNEYMHYITKNIMQTKNSFRHYISNNEVVDLACLLAVINYLKTFQGKTNYHRSL